MALSQCSSELSTSPFSSSQPPVCVTQSKQPCRLVLNPFLPGVTEVTHTHTRGSPFGSTCRIPAYTCPPDQHPLAQSPTSLPPNTETHTNHGGIKHSPGSGLTFYLPLSFFNHCVKTHRS